MINFKVGILGAGVIAGTVCDTLNKLEAFEPYAVASRDAERAKSFAEKYGCTKYYGSYEELANDPEVELIYIATPHSHHAEQAKLCIEAGKPVLVEKAFSYNAASAEEVLKLAVEKKIFCGEAMWIRFLPMYKMLRMNLDKGVIGTVTDIHLSLGYDLKAVDRLKDPALAGGAMLDLGVYPLNIITMLTDSAPAAVSGMCAKLESGVDAQTSLHFRLQKGGMAECFVTMMYQPDNRGLIYGSNGYIEIDNINNPEAFRIYNKNHNLVAEITPPDSQISGYEYEFIAARDAIITGKPYAQEMPHTETLRILMMIDSLRKSWKIEFPMEKK